MCAFVISIDADSYFHACSQTTLMQGRPSLKSPLKRLRTGVRRCGPLPCPNCGEEASLSNNILSSSVSVAEAYEGSPSTSSSIFARRREEKMACRPSQKLNFAVFCWIQPFCSCCHKPCKQNVPAILLFVHFPACYRQSCHKYNVQWTVGTSHIPLQGPFWQPNTQPTHWWQGRLANSRPIASLPNGQNIITLTDMT